MKKMCFILINFVLSFNLNAYASPTPMEKIKVPIAILLRFEHTYDKTREHLWKGMELALREFENSQPQSKHQFDFKKFSHGESLESQARAIKQIQKEGIRFIIGGEFSHDAIFIADLMNAEEQLLFATLATSPKVTEDKPHVFALTPSDAISGEQFANYLAELVNPKKLGISHNISHPYTDFASQKFLDAYLKKSGEPQEAIIHEKFVRGHADFAQIAKRFKEAGVTHVVAYMYESRFFSLVRECWALNYYPVFLGGDSWGSYEHIMSRLVRSSPLGHHFHSFRLAHWNADWKNPWTVKFKQAYQRAYNEVPNLWAATGFDSAWILLSLIEKQGASATMKTFREALKSDSFLSIRSKGLRFDQRSASDVKMFIEEIKGDRLLVKEVK